MYLLRQVAYPAHIYIKQDGWLQKPLIVSTQYGDSFLSHFSWKASSTINILKKPLYSFLRTVEELKINKPRHVVQGEEV